MPRVAKKKKPLRGSVRQSAKSVAPQVEAPRGPRLSFGVRLAMLVLGAIFLMVFVTWIYHSSWPRSLGRFIATGTIETTKRIGFEIKDVSVSGRRYTSKKELFDALNIRAGGPILVFDPEQAYANIRQLPWVEKATIIRSLPNRIVIQLTERQPIARWQHNETISVIDGEGRELTAAKAEFFSNLPLVMGEAAPEQTKTLLATLQNYPVVTRVLKTAVRVSERRWNLYLNPDLLIRLPEDDMESALDKLTSLIEDKKIFDRDIKAIDLRIPDRMIIEPGSSTSNAPQEAPSTQKKGTGE
ncbi:MAG: FtsQ-type POTRA domain-containing protein [Proteobacteria bacterium]|nr:FtsQ-type POTRA domain-containing protein [Pseudomonadota bacterium]